MFVGSRLRDARHAKSWSQEKLARKLSFHLKRTIRARQVIRHENGTQPSPEFLGAYASIFGLPAEHFLGADDDEEAAQAMTLDEFLEMRVAQILERQRARERV